MTKPVKPKVQPSIVAKLLIELDESGKFHVTGNPLLAGILDGNVREPLLGLSLSLQQKWKSKRQEK
jgi:hypothetical protein